MYPGFSPVNELAKYRNSIAAYFDMEADLSSSLLVSLAARFENYSDFGSTLNFKLASRYKLNKNINIRAAANTGFRAPSLHQAWFNNVSTQFVIDPATGALTPSQVMTAHNKSAVAKAFGIPDLEEEKSLNISAGFTAKLTDGLSISADLYSINIDDRIVLTSRFSNSDPIVAQILAPFANSGVSQAQIFSNAVDTETKGFDVSISYATLIGNGSLSLTAVGNITSTEVVNINIPQSVANRFAGGDLNAVESTIFNREERNRLEDALPRQKGSLTATYSLDKVSFTVRGNYYGSVEYKPTNEANDETFDPKVLLDLEASYELFDGLKLTIGANNALNTFPDEHELDGNRSGARFIYSRRVTQFGFNGAFFYTRLNILF